MNITTPHNEIRSPFRLSSTIASNGHFWRWGDDNMFPQALALMSRRGAVHRRIINDKADYISGQGFTHDDDTAMADFLSCVNSSGETMRQILNKLAFDKSLFGNAFIEIVTDPERSFLALFHQDASKCRVSRDNRSIILHHDWRRFTEKDAASIPLYPHFEKGTDGFLHSCIHYKDYEPGFSHYGVPAYIAGLNVSAIAYKTDCWNISRLDNSFQPSGVLLIDGEMNSDDEAAELMKRAERKFAGNPGQVMFLIKDCKGADSTHFVPMSTTSDGDWRALHEQAGADIIVAHSWFRTLSGLNYSSGFDRERILNEYEAQYHYPHRTGGANGAHQTINRRYFGTRLQLLTDCKSSSYPK